MRHELKKDNTIAIIAHTDVRGNLSNYIQIVAPDMTTVLIKIGATNYQNLLKLAQHEQNTAQGGATKK